MKMQKVIAYKLVSDIRSNVLDSTVNKKITEGWVPSGPVVVYENNLVQAMVKFEDS